MPHNSGQSAADQVKVRRKDDRRGDVGGGTGIGGGVSPMDRWGVSQFKLWPPVADITLISRHYHRADLDLCRGACVADRSDVATSQARHPQYNRSLARLYVNAFRLSTTGILCVCVCTGWWAFALAAPNPIVRGRFNLFFAYLFIYLFVLLVCRFFSRVAAPLRCL